MNLRVVRRTMMTVGLAVLTALLLTCVRNASAQEEAANAGERQAALTEWDGKLHLGTEFFLNRSETKETVEKHFAEMHENGISVVRIFVIWDDIERVPGEWDLGHYQWIYDAAAKNGIKIAATLCTEDPPGWMDRTTFYHQRANLDDPELKAHATEYIEKFVGHFKDHPGTGFWLLMNEPSKYHEDASTFHAFGQWLENKYGTVEEVNRHWFRPIKSFDRVEIIENHDPPNYWVDEEEWLDWKEFNVDNLIATLGWIREKVLAIDSKHPIHFNVTEPTGDADGQDVWKEKSVTDILGVSMHTAWAVPPETPEKNYGELYAYRLDLIASAALASPQVPFWVTELQSGPTIYTGQFSLTPSPQDLTRWVWDSYGAGANSVVFWLWHPRDIGTEAGEWGIVGLHGQPTPRLSAIKAVAKVLDANPQLAAMHPQPARVAILYDRHAAMVNDLDGKWQRGRENRAEDVQNALKGCYLALFRAHIPAQYVDIDQLKHGEVNRFAVLYVPTVYAMDDATVAALKEYVKQGGTLWADGPTGWKNERGRIRGSIPGDLTDLFGLEAAEINAVQAANPYSVTPQKELGGELWKLPAKVKSGATVVLKDGDGNPFEVKNRYGKGTVTYFTSSVTLAYLRRGNPVVHQWILEPALKHAADTPVQLKKGSDHLLFRGLVGASGEAAILTDWGETQTATVLFKGSHRIKNLVTGLEVPATEVGGNTLATLQVTAGADAVLVTQ